VHGRARGAPGIAIHGTEALGSPHPPLQPLQVPATRKISSSFTQAPFPQSPCVRSGQSLHYHLPFSTSFPLVAAQGNLPAKSCQGRVWCIFLARPRLFLLWLSNPDRIIEEATPAVLGSREASPLPSGETCIHAGGWQGAWAPLRGCSQGASARDPLPSPVLV